MTWDAPNSSLRLRRPVPGVVVITLSGTDVGEHGDGPFRELEQDVRSPFDLFVDARASRGVTIEVSAEWTRFLAKHRQALRSFHMLTGSRFVQLTANFVRNFAQFGELMRIYTEAAAFDEELAARLAQIRR
jgi:hypothetical protein